jgi:pimeloyl-ACP methyl ester carboxylesterase
MLKNDILPRHVGGGPLRAHAIGEMQEMAMSLGADTYVRQERAMQRRRDQQSTLRRITQPTLILAGEDDQIVPLKRQEFLAELIPYAKFGVLRGIGHTVMLEDPEGTTEALYTWMRQPLVLR